MKQDIHIISPKDAEKRLDLFLSEQTGESRSQIQKTIKDGQVSLDGETITKVSRILREGGIVTVNEMISAPTAKEVMVEQKPIVLPSIEIIAETSDYLVVNKPSGLLVHPTQAHEPITLVAALVKKHPELKKVGENPVRPGIVHRLDKDASGLLVIARTQKMFFHLKNQFQNREVEKWYAVLVYGSIERDTGIIDFDIARGADGKMVARPKVKEMNLRKIKKNQDGKTALTEFDVIQRFPRFTLLDVRIHSGRTHQIRVHMFAYGNPVFGDTLYYNKKLPKKHDSILDQLFLHAKKLCFKDLDNQKQCFESPLPPTLEDYLNTLTTV